MSVYVPLSDIAIQVGTVMSRSTMDGGPRRPTERTSTVLLEVETSTLLRLEWLARTRTLF